MQWTILGVSGKAIIQLPIHFGISSLDIIMSLLWSEDSEIEKFDWLYIQFSCKVLYLDIIW